MSEKVYDEALRTWPRITPGIPTDPRIRAAECANHVLLVAREHGEEPKTAPR